MRVTYAKYGVHGFGPTLSNGYAASYYGGTFEVLRRLVCLTQIQENVEIREEQLPPQPPCMLGAYREALWSPVGEPWGELPRFCQASAAD